MDVSTTYLNDDYQLIGLGEYLDYSGIGEAAPDPPPVPPVTDALPKQSKIIIGIGVGGGF